MTILIRTNTLEMFALTSKLYRRIMIILKLFQLQTNRSVNVILKLEKPAVKVEFGPLLESLPAFGG